MNSDYASNMKIRTRGTSAVIELDIAYAKSRQMSQTSFSNQALMGTDPQSFAGDLEELGASLDLTTENGKPIGTHVDEDGCPDKPPDMRSYRCPHMKALCRGYREAIRTAPYVTLNFRIMRCNAPMYVGYLVSSKGVSRSKLYTPEHLPIWTHCIRVRMRVNVKIGLIFHGLKSRLGLASVGLHFCVDGFLGVEDFGDAFGNFGSGICPWMELSSNGSAKSLRLQDGDNIYISMATESMRHLADQRKIRANKRPSMESDVTQNRSKKGARFNI